MVQVRKGKYPVSDSDAACSVGEHATSLPKQKIFRFNPGKTGKVFPPKHPYLPKGCGSCELSKIIKLYTPQDKPLPMCKACGIIMKQCLDQQKQAINQWKTKNIPERTGVTVLGNNFKSGSLLINRRSISEILGHTQNIAVRNSVFGILKGSLKYKYLGWLPCKAGKHPEAAYFTYYEVIIGGKTYYANVKMHKHYRKETLYCIRDKCDVAALNTNTPPTI